MPFPKCCPGLEEHCRDCITWCNMKDRFISSSQVEMHLVQNEYEGKDCGSVENPLFIVVKFKGTNCAPTATKILGIHQTSF